MIGCAKPISLFWCNGFRAYRQTQNWVFKKLKDNFIHYHNIKTKSRAACKNRTCVYGLRNRCFTTKLKRHGASEENRTPVCSLGRNHSTIEPHSQLTNNITLKFTFYPQPYTFKPISYTLDPGVLRISSCFCFVLRFYKHIFCLTRPCLVKLLITKLF